MTYSRPGIRQTNANAGAPKPDRIRVGSAPQVQGSTTARLVDNSSPEIAAYNAGRGQAEMADFLKNLIEPVAQIGEQIDIAVANQQVGTLMTEIPNLGELYRDADPDTRNRISAMSARAQDQLLGNMAEEGAVRFLTGYSTAAQASPVLTSDSSTEAERTAEKTRIRQEQFEESFGGLPPGYVASVGSQLAQVEGDVEGNLIKLRDANQRRRSDAREAQAMGTQITKFGALLDATGPTESDSENGLVVQGATQYLQDQIRQSYEGGSALPLGVFQRLLKGVQAENARLLGLGEYEQAEANLDLLRTLSAQRIDVGDGKTDFWSLNLQGANGKSTGLNEWLLGQDRVIASARTAGAKKSVEQEIAGYADILQRGEPAQRDAAFIGGLSRAQELIAQGRSAEGLMLLQQLNSFRSYAAAPTEMQESFLASEMLKPEFKGLSPSAKAERLAAWQRQGEITLSQQTAATQQIVTGPTQLDNEINTATSAARTQGTLTPLAVDLAQARQSLPGSPEVELRNVQAEVEAAAAQRTAEQVKTMRDNGEAVDNDKIRELYETNAGAYVAEKLEAIEGQKQQAQERRKATSEQLGEFLVAQSNGTKGLASIPQVLVDEYKESNPGKKGTYRELVDYLAAKMVRTGVPAWASKEQAVDWIQKQLRQKKTDPTPPEEQPASVPGENEGPNMTQEEWESKPWWDRPVISPDDFRKQQQRQRENQENNRADATPPDENKIASVALGAIGGLLGGAPARAGELPDVPVVNEDQMATLRALWENRQAPTLSVPPLPQLAANAPVQTVSMAMTSANHPMAVAIGIAEGTRTSNGGYTRNYYQHRDPGNGAVNQGTFSAQQGYATPEQADRAWLAKLTRTQMAMVPILERAGLPAGTQGHNRLLFNLLDLRAQSPAAFESLVTKIPAIISQGTSIEAIAKARADSFFIPGTNRLDTTFGSYSALFTDQRSRAGVWDYRRRI